jgi:serine O-acetyltransferase
MLNALRADLAIIKERDPAARGVLEILCCYPGLHALTLHRFSHTLWRLRVVIGETAVIGDQCLLYQGVTLGGTGKAHGKRHPTLASNVVVGAGAKVLGAIEVGANTRIGAGSVVLRDVAPDSTVVGIPGRVIHQSGVRIDPLAHSALPDAEARVIRNLMERIDQLEGELARTQACLRELAAGRPLLEPCRGEAQSLKDREILEFLGQDERA